MEQKTSKWTIVRLSRETVERLKKHKRVKMETYDEVIKRILDFYEQFYKNVEQR